MKKRAISFVLCLMMVVTLLNNGIPVYAEATEQPVIMTEETTNEVTEDAAPLKTSPEAEPSVEPEEVTDAALPENETTEPPEKPSAEETVETPETGAEQPETASSDTPEADAGGGKLAASAPANELTVPEVDTQDVEEQMNPNLTNAAGDTFEPVLLENDFSLSATTNDALNESKLADCHFYGIKGTANVKRLKNSDYFYIRQRNSRGNWP